jgi:hypothetical protein
MPEISITAIFALVISIASLSFSIYQYQILHRVRKNERATTLIRLTQDLRRKSEDLKHTIDSTDDVDDCEEFLFKLNTLTEVVIPKLAASKKLSIQELFEIEQRLLSTELELDLLQKQIVMVGKFNAEVPKREANYF